MTEPITRRKSGLRFQYYSATGKITDKDEVKRINALAIPPAWKKVEIAPNPKTKVQARGYDAAGRLQAIYSPAFRLKQEKAKFEKILDFADALPKLRSVVEKDLRRNKLGKEKVLACIIKLIDREYFRVGNKQYAAQNQSYGITTLRSKHASISTTKVTFDFIGKSGKQHVKTIKDPKIARIVKQLDELPGQELFRYKDETGTMHDITSADVNAYIKEHMGDAFTAKDFRTWGGTMLATSAALAQKYDENASPTAKKKAAQKIVKKVSKRLGNTPAIAKGSYIDPRVFEALDDGKTLPKLKSKMASMKPRKYMTTEEQLVLQLLRKDS
jgi:DNA topoisomerase-1